MPGSVYKVVFSDGEERFNPRWTRAAAVARAKHHLAHRPGPAARLYRARHLPGGGYGAWTFVRAVAASKAAKAACACQTRRPGPEVYNAGERTHQHACTCQTKRPARRSAQTTTRARASRTTRGAVRGTTARRR